MTTRSKSKIARGRGDSGAALLEFAFLVFPLFLIVFGIIEFGWTFSQNLDVRHGAREGSRLIAVNYKPNSVATQLNDIVVETCSRMSTTTGSTISLQVPAQGAPIGKTGQKAEVIVTKPVQTLTGFLDFALGGKTLTSKVDVRLEQDATWTTDNNVHTVACP